MIYKKIKVDMERRAKNLKKDIGALFYAYRNEGTPLLAKILLIIVVGYAMSPVDLIPDFIPVLGYLDDIMLLPLGIALAIKLVPNDVMEASRIKAEKYFMKDKKSDWGAFAVILFIWCLIIYGILKLVLSFI